jgi:hypothetical protein
MYQIELVEGKDALTPNTQPHSDKGRTVGLLLRLCAGIAGRGMVVILNSGFCVLQGLVELKKIGVFASAFILKSGAMIGPSMFQESRSMIKC